MAAPRHARLVRNRAKRIALPLVLACTTVVPVMWAIISWAGTGNPAYGATDPGKDIWTAAVYGDVDAVRDRVVGGSSLDQEDPVYGQSPLAWAVIGGQQRVVEYLLDAGADPNYCYRDRNTALHTAAFFGRAEAASRLLKAGADPGATNAQGETPIDSMRHDQRTTEFIEGLLKLPIEFDAVLAGRSRIRTMLEDHIPAGDHQGNESGARRSRLERVFGPLMFGDFFLHLWFLLWFLWFLCWLVAAFVPVVRVFGRLPKINAPLRRVSTPLCLFWLVPLTMLTQSFMHRGGEIPGFGPDTSSGIVPIPWILAHYAIFFGFGAVIHGVPGATYRLGRRWWIHLSIAMLLLPGALAMSFGMPWARELTGDQGTRRLLANLAQVLYAWLMIFVGAIHL